MFQPEKPQRNLAYAWEGEVDGLRAEIERLLRCIKGIEDHLLENPPRIGDALWICEAAKAV